MTAVHTGAPPPTPAPPPPALPRAAHSKTAALVRRRLVRAGGVAAGVGWWMAGRVVRFPKTSAALGVTLAATTPVTVGHITGVVVTGCAAAGSAYWGGREQRQSLAILHTSAKFRKRLRRVRRHWVTVMADAGWVKQPAEGATAKRMPKRKRIRQTRLGLSIKVYAGGVSISPGDVRAKADKLRSGFGCRDVKVRDLGGGFHLWTLTFDDPFRRIIPVAGLPAPSKRLNVVVGLDEDGQPIEKDLRLPNLIVGMQGAGKSSEVWTTLHGLQESGIPHRVRVFDPKGGQEFGELEDAAYYYERNPTKWPQFLEHAIRGMEVRQDALRKAGLRKNPFTWENPLDLMVIDELLTVLAMSSGSAKVKVGGAQVKASDAFMVYLSTARAAGYGLLACSQLSQKSTIGDIRDLFGYVTCLRVTSDDIVNTILGQGASKAYPAHELPKTEDTAGIGFFATETGIRKYRAAYPSDRERARVVRRMKADTERFRRRDAEGVPA